MILQALCQYYERKAADPSSALAPEGFEQKEIPFVIVLDENGCVVELQDTREGEGKKRRARSFLVPQGVKKTSGIAANLLWDTAEYVLGVDTRGKSDRVQQQHEAFKSRIRNELAAVHEDAGIKALMRCLDTLDLSSFERFPAWEEIKTTNPVVTVRLAGDLDLICQRPAVVKALSSGTTEDGAVSICLVSGEQDVTERLHTSIKGVLGAQTSGANIVSFNLPAFNSWGKEQGDNAPVGKKAAFAYTTALNHLLRKDSRQRMQVGDATTVFWSEKESSMESEFPLYFLDSPKDDPDAGAEAVRNLYSSVSNGVYSKPDKDTLFYILGLAPNAARIAVRFWHVDTIAEVSKKIASYFNELDITGREKFGWPSLFRLLVNIAVQEKADNIPPNLAGDTMRAILEDLPFPAMLLQSAIRRCRASQSVNYYRAALIKAVLNRSIRKHKSNEKELTVALDTTNPNVGYRLGRLFAVLEKIQEEANPSLNATIRERFYGAASATPVTVFANLLKLKNHHLAKLDNPNRKTYFEKLIGEIMSGLNGFPAHLPLPEQGFFAIGYYHQRQDFYTRKTESAQGE